MMKHTYTHKKSRFKAVLFLSLIIYLFVFFSAGLSVAAENRIISDNEFSSFVSITSFSNRTKALTLSTVEGNNISILYPNLRVDIIADENSSYHIQLGSHTIANGTMHSKHITIYLQLNETKADLTVVVNKDMHNFGLVAIKKHLDRKDIGGPPEDMIEITKDEFSWAQWQAGLGAFVGSLMSLPLAYVAVKYYLERRGEYAT